MRRMLASISHVRWLAHTTVVVAMVLVAGATLTAQQDAPTNRFVSRVVTLPDTLIGSAANLTMDAEGVIYAATFSDKVYKVWRDGRSEVFATGLYGATGNAIDPHGNLYQANFFGGYLTKIDRHGNQEIVADGLSSPMGVAVGGESVFVCNCDSNAISRITLDGEVTTFVRGAPFNCPNAIARTPDGDLFVANFYDAKLLKISPDGKVSEFATLPHAKNNMAAGQSHLYVASIEGRQVHRVSLTTGEVTLLAGSGEEGQTDGTALEATFSALNGIAATPTGGLVFVSDFVTPQGSGSLLPPITRFTVRMIATPSLVSRVASTFDEGGVEAVEEAYRSFRADPATAALLDEATMDAYGQAEMRGALPLAIKIFELNAESYPGSWRAWASLAGAHEQGGDTERAIKFYEKSLSLNPDNEDLVLKLRELRADS